MIAMTTSSSINVKPLRRASETKVPLNILFTISPFQLRKQKTRQTQPHMACHKSGLSICDSPPITCIHIANVDAIFQLAEFIERKTTNTSESSAPPSVFQSSQPCDCERHLGQQH
jgi:hypothetical protein